MGMKPAPSSTITAPHVLVSIKPAMLDQDRSIALTDSVATGFAVEINQRLAMAGSIALLGGEKTQQLAKIITQERLFPFVADVEGGQLILTPKLDKHASPVLKDISDGITEVNKRFAAEASLSEQAKFAIAMLFQPAIYNAYHAAGIIEGPHTKYVTRAC